MLIITDSDKIAKLNCSPMYLNEPDYFNSQMQLKVNVQALSHHNFDHQNFNKLIKCIVGVNWTTTMCWEITLSTNIQLNLPQQSASQVFRLDSLRLEKSGQPNLSWSLRTSFHSSNHSSLCCKYRDSIMSYILIQQFMQDRILIGKK